MYAKCFIAWFGIVVLGLANATIRQLAYARYVGDLAAHQISTLTFARFYRTLTMPLILVGGEFFTARKMLYGIKRRVEQTTSWTIA